MNLNLEGRNIIVTGSSGLIGTELSIQLAQAQANLILIDISPKNKELCENLKRNHPKNMIVESDLDISQEKNVQSIAALVNDELGGTLHGLVNGLQFKSKAFFHDIKDTDAAELEDIFAANVFSIFWMMKHLSTPLKSAGGASVVNLSSTYALVSPNPAIYTNTDMGCPATYVATKGAVHSLTKYLACYLAKDKIRVNSVTPHGVYNNHQEVFVQNFSKLSPLARMSMSDEVAPAIMFLLSDKSSYITGTNLKIDGGWTAW